MKVEFLNKFSKDIDRIHLKSVKNNLIKLIEQVEAAENLNNIPNLKKLVGHNRLTVYVLLIIELVFFMKIIKLFLRGLCIERIFIMCFRDFQTAYSLNLGQRL